MTTTTDAPSAISLTAILAGRDVLCPRCDYNLRDLTSDRCPECGLDITIDLLLQRPRRVSPLPFGIALIGLAMGFIESWRYWTNVPSGWVPGYQGGELHVMTMQRWASDLYWLSLIPLTVFLLILHRRFNRLSATIRWSIAAAVALAALLGHRRILLPPW